MITCYIITFIVLTNNINAIGLPYFYSAPLNFKELAKANGYTAEEYDVTTEDGYILGLFRIRGNRGLPLLLMHGLADTSDTWVLRANRSLGITLARKGYDVWFGNVRGNKYSRRNLYLNPDKDAAFWDFSFHEHGYYDLAAIIDTVLDKTGAPKLYAFGHSQGTTIFYLLGSTRPEYNEKIQVMTSFAPICFLNHLPPPTSLLAKMTPIINVFAKLIGGDELFGNSASGKIVDFMCRQGPISYHVCGFGIIFPLTGFDIKEFEPEFYQIAIKHFLNSISRKNTDHFSQVWYRNKFARYDYGLLQNIFKYKSFNPPNYDLKKVTMPIVLLVGRNDKVSVVEDVKTLKAQLPNVIKYAIIDRKLMNHMDFVWGLNMEDYLFPHVFQVLEGNNFM